MGDWDAFASVKVWIFDLDNTLYPRSCDLFSQIDRLMTQYVMELTGYAFADARRLQKQLYHEYGTTLNGLMLTRNIDPEHYLDAVHNIDYSPVTAHPELVATIARLPGRKFIFTNADTNHAEAVLRRLGGADLFDGMFDIKGADYRPKPHRSAYEKCLATFGISAPEAAMFDDLERNLSVPHELGMRTVHIVPDVEVDDHDDQAPSIPLSTGYEHIHHTTNNLPHFLSELAKSVF